VGAHLLRGARDEGYEVFYWREGRHEVDFVAVRGGKVTAIEVESGKPRAGIPGIAAFQEAFKAHRLLLVGENGIGVEAFPSKPASHWLA